MGYHFWPDFAFVYGLRVDYLSPTIYLTDLLVLLILGQWFYKCKIKNEKFKIEIKNLKLIIFFLGFFLFNCLLAGNRGAAFYKLIKIIELALLGIYVAKNRYLLRVTRYALPWVLIYSSLIAVVQFFKQGSLGGFFWWLGERSFNSSTPGIAQVDFWGRQVLRPYGTFSHPNSLAGFLLAGGIVLAQFIARQRARTEVRDYIFPFFSFLLTLLAIFLSFSRAAWVVGGLVVGGGFWVVGRRKLGILASLGAGVIGGLGGLGSGFWESSLSFQRRMVLNGAALAMIKASPLLGVGLNNFISRLPEFWQPQEAIRFLQPVHNIYLLAGAETGLIGAIGVIGGIGVTLRKVWQEKRWPVFWALAAIVLLGLFDHYWLTLQQNQLLLAIILGWAWRREKT